MKQFNFRRAVISAVEVGGVYKYTSKIKGVDVTWASADETLYNDVDDNERRSRAARSYIYEKIKSMYYNLYRDDKE